MDRSSRNFFLGLLGIMSLFAALRWPLIAVPMERDEGEYATIGLGILHGIPPYSEAYTMKLPGGASLYACIFWLLGPSVRSLHLALLFVNAMTIGLVAMVGRKLMGWQAGLFAGAAYGTFTIGTGMFGFWLSAEHFCTLFLMAGAWMLLGGSQKSEVRSQNAETHKAKKGEGISTPFLFSRLLSSSLCGSFFLGCSIVVKHHAALPAFAWLAVAIWKKTCGNRQGLCPQPQISSTQHPVPSPQSSVLPPRSSVLCPLSSVRSPQCPLLAAVGMLLAFVAPTLITMALMAYCGVWEKFRFWTWDYAKQYATAVPLGMGWEYFKLTSGNLFPDAPLLWMLSFIGLTALMARPSAIPSVTSACGWLIPVTFLSGVAVSMGLMFRGQYFILLAPAAALLCGAAWETLRGWHPGNREAGFNPPALKYLPEAALLVGSFFVLVEPLFTNPEGICRKVYGMNPFPEYPAIANYLKQHTRPDEKIAVIGSEPAIYFLADRRPATPYLCIYEAMKPHSYARTMQKEIIHCLEVSRPRALVFVDVPTSWGSTPQSDPTLLEWLKLFIPQHYQLAGVVDLTSPTPVIRWGAAARVYHPRSPYQMWVFQRKD